MRYYFNHITIIHIERYWGEKVRYFWVAALQEIFTSFFILYIFVKNTLLV